MLEDLVAITQGAHQPDTIDLILHSVLQRQESIHAATQVHSQCMPILIKWFSVLCTIVQQSLNHSNITTVQWMLSSMMLSSINEYFSQLSKSWSATNDGLFFRHTSVDFGAVEFNENRYKDKDDSLSNDEANSTQTA